MVPDNCQVILANCSGILTYSSDMGKWIELDTRNRYLSKGGRLWIMNFIYIRIRASWTCSAKQKAKAGVIIS